MSRRIPKAQRRILVAMITFRDVERVECEDVLALRRRGLIVRGIGRVVASITGGGHMEYEWRLTPRGRGVARTLARNELDRHAAHGSRQTGLILSSWLVQPPQPIAPPNSEGYFGYIPIGYKLGAVSCTHRRLTLAEQRANLGGMWTDIAARLKLGS